VSSAPVHEWFFDHIRDGFQRAIGTGTVQYYCEGEQFFVTVAESEISCSTGVHPEPTSVVRGPRSVFERLVFEPGRVDPRDPSIYPLLTVTGDRWLPHFVWWLTHRPGEAHVRRYRDLEERAASRHPIEVVERVHDPSDADVRAALAEGVPMLASGCLDHWPRIPDLQTLKARFGHVPFKLYGSTHEISTLGGFADLLLSDLQAPMTSGGVLCPEELRSLFTPRCLGGENFTLPQFWLARVQDARKPITPIHQDEIPSFLGHVFGPKRFLLYSPDQAKSLYVLDKTYRRGRLAAVQPWNPDYKRFPLFEHARALEIILQPGDLLLIPSGWFHEAYVTPEPALSVGSFYNEWAG
jgi:cupin-like protein